MDNIIKLELSEYFKRCCINQAAFAERFGISREHLNRVLIGKIAPSKHMKKYMSEYMEEIKQTEINYE